MYCQRPEVTTDRVRAVLQRLAPLANRAGLPREELRQVALVVELGERIIAADPDCEGAAMVRRIIEHIFRTRLGVEFDPVGRA